MDVSKIASGKNVPEDINVVIEIPQGSSVKYEIDKESGALIVDRFLFTPMCYPTAYGFIPNTLAADGDPIDALVLTPADVVPASVIRSRPIGVLKMEDESGVDEKIICVPHAKIHNGYEHMEDINDLPDYLKETISHFFQHYKDLEPGKWVKVTGWDNKRAACQFIEEAIKNNKAT